LKVLLGNAEGNDKKKLESIAKDITELQKMVVPAE